MTSISRTRDLLATIHSLAPGRADGSSLATRPAARDGKAGSSPAVGRYVAERIASIAPDDPNRRRRAFRYFLEGSLLDLLGSEAIVDLTFQQAVDQIEQVMAQDAKLASAVERLADRLLAGIGNGRNLSDLSAVFDSD